METEDLLIYRKKAIAKPNARGRRRNEEWLLLSRHLSVFTLKHDESTHWITLFAVNKLKLIFYSWSKLPTNRLDFAKQQQRTVILICFAIPRGRIEANNSFKASSFVSLHARFRFWRWWLNWISSENQSSRRNFLNERKITHDAWNLQISWMKFALIVSTSSWYARWNHRRDVTGIEKRKCLLKEPTQSKIHNFISQSSFVTSLLNWRLTPFNIVSLSFLWKVFSARHWKSPQFINPVCLVGKTPTEKQKEKLSWTVKRNTRKKSSRDRSLFKDNFPFKLWRSNVKD